MRRTGYQSLPREDVPMLLEDYLNSLTDSGNSHERKLASSL